MHNIKIPTDQISAETTELLSGKAYLRLPVITFINQETIDYSQLDIKLSNYKYYQN